MKLQALLLILMVASIFSNCSVGELPEPPTNGFSNNPQSLHYIIITIDTQAVSIDKLKDELQSFNQENRRSELALRISNLLLSGTESNPTPLVIIRRFSDFRTADKYANSLHRSLKKNGLPVKSVLPISQNNYRHLLREKDLQAYYRFADLALR